MRSLAKALLDSMRAAAADGPKTGTPDCFSRSARPKARGVSGPTTARSIRFPAAQPESATTSVGEMSTARHPGAMPPFGRVAWKVAPGASSRSFQSSACSRPPFPAMRIRMGVRAAF